MDHLNFGLLDTLFRVPSASNSDQPLQADMLKVSSLRGHVFGRMV